MCFYRGAKHFEDSKKKTKKNRQYELDMTKIFDVALGLMQSGPPNMVRLDLYQPNQNPTVNQSYCQLLSFLPLSNH